MAGPEPNSPLFRFDQVEVDAGGRAVLSGVDLLIPAVGITVVVGPSGAGKTTLLRLCNRLEVPTAGSVWYRGGDLASIDVRALRREVGMVFQRPVIFGGTVRDNLAVAHPDASAEALAAALVDVQLDPGLLDREADTLSGGEAQRLCLARTLLTCPAALLLDEPTSALDARPKLAFERLTRRLADQGVASVWVTHDLDQAVRLATYVVVLDAGRVVDVGDPSHLRSSRVAAIIGGRDRGAER